MSFQKMNTFDKKIFEHFSNYQRKTKIMLRGMDYP